MKSLFLISIISIIFLQVIVESVVSTIDNGISQITEKMSNFTEMTPEECPIYMELVPVDDDNSSSWICDCSFRGYLYFLEDNFCYPAYKQGPCPPQYYLILPPEENLAKCEKNPCLEDGLVPFEGTCAHLYRQGSPCLPGFTLSVNPENFQLMCVLRQLNIITAPEIKCPRGTRRNALGACKKEFS